MPTGHHLASEAREERSKRKSHGATFISRLPHLLTWQLFSESLKPCTHRELPVQNGDPIRGGEKNHAQDKTKSCHFSTESLFITPPFSSKIRFAVLTTVVLMLDHACYIRFSDSLLLTCLVHAFFPSICLRKIRVHSWSLLLCSHNHLDFDLLFSSLRDFSSCMLFFLSICIRKKPAGPTCVVSSVPLHMGNRLQKSASKRWGGGF